jgi:hypothetical protein
MESMSASKSPNIIIVLNDIQANRARVTRIGQEICRYRFLDVITIIVVFHVHVNAVIG